MLRGPVVGRLDVLAVDLRRHRREHPDDEEVPARDRERVARAVLDLRHLGRLVRDVVPRARLALLELEGDALDAVLDLDLDVGEVHRRSILERRAHLLRRARHRSSRSHWAVVVPLSEPSDDLSSPPQPATSSTRDNGKGEPLHRYELSAAHETPFRPLLPPARRPRRPSPSRCWPATTRTDERGTSSASASSSTSASFARPRSGGAATLAFQPSPCLPTSSVRVAPGETVTLIRATTRSGLGRAPRRPRCMRRPPPRCGRPRASTPPRAPASRRSRGSGCRARPAP